MKAIACALPLPASDPGSLFDCELPRPHAGGQDLLVAVQAVSVNPVDTKLRLRNDGTQRVLGYDAAGIVEQVGPDCSLFKAGDTVYYAGEITRAGSNAQFQLVDERIVGRKPAALSFADAAAMPLTLVTAWEGLYEQLGVTRDGAQAGRSLLVIGGAGGVGSIAIQLGRLAGLQVIATASRPESIDWCQKLGVQATVNHQGDLPAQLRELGLPTVDYVFNCADLTRYYPIAVELLTPRGGLCTILEAHAPLDITLLKSKSLRLTYEYMFTRSLHRSADMIEQHRILTAAAELFDQGRLTSTRSGTLPRIDAQQLRAAHAQLESGHTIGKLVLEGFQRAD